ncbi:MAG: MBL fold metallo-hydrolase [bacterium]
MRNEIQWGPVRFIQGQNKGRYPYCHSLYIEEAGVLIDPGSDRQVLQEIKAGGGVRQVWLSHWHEDHMIHLDLFEDLPIWISQQDAPPLGDLETFLDWYGMEEESYRQHWRDVLAGQFHLKPRRPAGFLVPGQRLELPGVTVEVIHTPGHTPGHLAFRFLEQGVLFLGDYDLTAFGPWYGDLYSSIEETLESVRVLREMDARVWIAGHEAGIFQEPPDSLWDSYVEVIKKREQKLLEFLKEPKTMDEIVKAWIVYGRPREPQAFFEFGEKAIMGKHLKRLVSQGLVSKEAGRFRSRG